MSSFRYQHGDRPLDGFTIEHGIGRGGFGEVYYAVSDAGRQVALKAVQNFEEIELRGIAHCMNLKSPHLVTIFDVKHNDAGDPFVIMEYVAGVSLRELLDQSPKGLGPAKASFFVREIAKGLTYLHDCGVVHRDLKPHNVFYEDGFVKIGDYSLSKIMSTSHRSGHTMTVGTVHYMAPEIGLGRYDKTVDIYALGIMLHEMLTGRPPFDGESVGEILMKHVSGQIDLDGIPQPFAYVIERATAKAPEDRYQSAQDMAEAVFGEEHIRNSVAEFNPQSLTLQAQQVGAKMPLGVGPSGGTADAGDSVIAADIVSDSVFPTSQSANNANGMPEGASDSTLDSNDEAMADLLSACSVTLDHKPGSDPLRPDPLSVQYRTTLAMATVFVTSLVAAILFPGIYGHGASWAALVTTCAVISLLGVTVVTAHERLSGDLEGEADGLGRFATAGICAAVLLPAMMVLNRSSMPRLFDFGTIFAALAPMLILDWRAVMSPWRRERFSLSTVLAAALIAGCVGLATGGAVLAATIACGVVLSVQCYCAFSPPAPGERRSERSGSKTLTHAMRSLGSHWQSRREAPADNKQPADAAREQAMEPVSTNHRLIALILAALPMVTMGMCPLFGLHRFYTGKIWTGILWLVTGGLLGIGQLIDTVMIAFGAFADADGLLVENWHGENHPNRKPSATEMATPVNQYSSVPKTTSQPPGPRIPLSSRLAAVIGYLLVPVAVLVGTLPALATHLVAAEGFGASLADQALTTFQTSAWPETVSHLAGIIATAIGVAAMAMIIVARRIHGLPHMFRALMAAAAFSVGVFNFNNELDAQTWPPLGTVVDNQHFGRWLELVFQSNSFNTGLVYLLCGLVGGFLILAWPPRRSRAPESNPG